MKKIVQSIIVLVLLVMSMGNSVFTQCTCPVGCSSLKDITIPFTQDGAGEYCFRTTCLGSYINSSNLGVLEINGLGQIIGYIDASIFPPPTGDGYYYIYYKSSVPWGHLELGGTCPATTPAPTATPAASATPPPTTMPTTTPAGVTPGGITGEPTIASSDGPTNEPTPDIVTIGPTQPPDTCIECTAITVPPEATDITSISAGTPAPTLVPKVGLFQMNYSGGSSAQVKPVCSTFEMTVYFNSGTTQLLSDYSINIVYDSTAMTPYICSGLNGVVEGANGFVSSVDVSAPGTLVINGTNTTGTGPGTALYVCSIMWKAISFGETSSIFYDSYVKQVTVTLTPNYARDTSGTTIGTPAGDTQVYVFYSGIAIPGSPD